jgi:hypothetical protein
MARSLETVQAARAVPASLENLPVTIPPALGVVHNVQQLYFALGSEAQTSVEGLIVLPIPETPKQADDNLDGAQSVLLSISNDAQTFGRNGSLVLREKEAAWAGNSVRMCGL